MDAVEGFFTELRNAVDTQPETADEQSDRNQWLTASVNASSMSVSSCTVIATRR